MNTRSVETMAAFLREYWPLSHMSVGVDMGRPGGDHSALSLMCSCGTVVEVSTFAHRELDPQKYLDRLQGAVVGHEMRDCPACGADYRGCTAHDCLAWRVSNARGRKMGRP